MTDTTRKTIILRRNGTRIFDVPGGSVEISRTTDGDYWIHIGIETERRTGEKDDIGRVTDSRIDYTDGRRIASVPDAAQVEHIALRISTNRDDE